MDTKAQIEQLLEKGVSEILPSKDFLKSKLENGQKLTIYCGFDPTAPTLHIGHAITLRKLRQFQDLGHKVIFLIGDFTARIGDPTDKSAARTKLTEKEIKANLKEYKKQAASFIRFSGKNAAEVKFNNEWLGKMKFADVLELASHMTVDQMLKRDMFARRISEEKPIYIHEFMYPLMQGYDSVALNVDGEVGGNDQLFNMLAGRTLLKTIKNKEKFVITMKLLADANGKKMGKSEGNMIALSDAPSDMYGKVMSWTDGMIVPGFELCTDIKIEEIAAVEEEIKTGNPRDVKMRLAYEIVKSCLGESAAKRAQSAFVATFQKKESADDAIEITANERTLETVLIEEGIVPSKSELRRLTAGGAIMNFDTKEKITEEDLKTATKRAIYKIGKSRFIKIV
jgi:tyrosyl-tRNA synthetase